MQYVLPAVQWGFIPAVIVLVRPSAQPRGSACRGRAAIDAPRCEPPAAPRPTIQPAPRARRPARTHQGMYTTKPRPTLGQFFFVG
jgi:hypothetical protein